MSQFGSQFHGKPDRKGSGNGKLKSKIRDKRRSEMGGYFAATRAGTARRIKRVRIRGGSAKVKLISALFANVLTSSGYKKAKITGVAESKDNRNFARLGIITKGAIINTELGKARVTNRPGQEGTVNALLLSG